MLKKAAIQHTQGIEKFNPKYSLPNHANEFLRSVLVQKFITPQGTTIFVRENYEHTVGGPSILF